MKVAEVKATTRLVRSVDKYGVVGYKTQPCVQVIIGGLPFSHDCESMEKARQLAYRLGLEYDRA